MLRNYYGWVKWLFLEQISGIYLSQILMVLIFAAFVTLIPGYILHVKKNVSIRRVILYFFTVAYAGIMLLLTIFRREWWSRSSYINIYLNLGITFDGVYSSMEVVYSMFNFFMFFFWGILLALFRTDQKPIRIIAMTTVIGFISSDIIETMQFLTGTGHFEMTDLVTNVAGAFCGAVFVAIGVLISKRMSRHE